MAARRYPKRDVLRWFLKRAYAKEYGRIIAGTCYTVFRFELYDLDEVEWVQSVCWAVGAHMFAREYNPDARNWDCELRIPRRSQKTLKFKEGEKTDGID